MSPGPTKRGLRRTASLALVLALAAPTQLPAFAQGVALGDAGGQPDVSAPVNAGAPDNAGAPGDDGAQKGEAPAPPADAPPVFNKSETAAPPAGQSQPNEGAPIGLDKAGDKGVVSKSSGPGDAMADAPLDPDAEPGAGAVTADAAKGDAGGDDAAADGTASADAAGEDAAAILVADTKPDHQPAGVAGQLAGWIRATDDNGRKPFAVIDKVGARIFVFAPDGMLLGAAPVLVGLARGDDSVSGIGDKTLAQIGPKDRTTPAGRFVARFGPAAGEHKTVLWVDYNDAISMHPVITTNPKEHRLKRIKSANAADHRISWGCINVPATFYDKVVLTSFRKGGGIVYILPDTRPVREFFPAFAAAVGAYAADDQASETAANGAAGAGDEHLPPYPLADDPLGPDPLARDPPARGAEPVATDPVAADMQPAPGPGADSVAADPADDPNGAVATQPAQPTADAPKPHRHTKTRRTHRTTAPLPG